MNWVTAREAFARQVTAHAAWPERENRLFEAFRAIPRENFLGVFNTGNPARIYRDATIPLAASGINNGQPSLHAYCLAALYPRVGERAVHIGAGAGYYTAILARLVGADRPESGQVNAYEIEPELARRSAANLAPFPSVRVHATSGVVAPLPASDLIYVNCGASGPLAHWLDALAPAGRLLFPLTSNEGTGAMLLIIRGADNQPWPARFLIPVTFIGCKDARNPNESAVVAAAFRHGHPATVRRLRRGPAPDSTAWCTTASWSLLP